MNEENKLDIRFGHGFDVHAFAPERRLVLGGVVIPFEKGLDGHSDADVVIHALMDAMLGALADTGRISYTAMERLARYLDARAAESPEYDYD